MISLHKKELLFKKSITQNVLVQVKKASQKVIKDFNKVKKADDSIRANKMIPIIVKNI